MSLQKSFFKNSSICQGLSGMLISNAVEVMSLAPLMTSSLNLLDHELSYIINGIVQTIFLERTFCLKAHHHGVCSSATITCSNQILMVKKTTAGFMSVLGQDRHTSATVCAYLFRVPLFCGVPSFPFFPMHTWLSFLEI